MKHLILISFFITSFSSFGQFDKSTSLRATGNFNIVLNGLATNNAGLGLGFDASFFAKHKLQVLIEISSDHFIGDKVLIIDTITGKENKRAAVYSIMAGPQFFVFKNIAVSATYGPSWYTIRAFNYSYTYGIKYSITGFFGLQKRFTAKVFMTDIPAEEQNIQYIGLAAGYRFR